MRRMWMLCTMWTEAEKDKCSKTIFRAAADTMMYLPANAVTVCCCQCEACTYDASHQSTTKADEAKRVGTRRRRAA
jgi:hypothetical protein